MRRMWVVWANAEFNEIVEVLGIRSSVLDALAFAQQQKQNDCGFPWDVVHIERWKVGGDREQDLSVLRADEVFQCSRCDQQAVVTEWPSTGTGLTHLCLRHLDVQLEALCRIAGTNIAPGVPIGMPACSEVCGACIGREDDTPVTMECGACGHTETMARKNIRPDLYGPRCLCGGNDWRYPNGTRLPYRKAGM